MLLLASGEEEDMASEADASCWPVGLVGGGLPACWGGVYVVRMF